MKRLSMSFAAAVAAVFFGMSSVAFSAVYHVDLDLPSLGIGSGVTDVQLEIQLYDNNLIYGDSWARIDNVILGTDGDDFEDGTLGGFVEVYNPDPPDLDPSSVSNEEILPTPGNNVLRIDESLEFFSVIAYRDFWSRDGDVLSFDVEAVLGPPVPPDELWTADELVFSLLDPFTLSPLAEGFTPGFGDVAYINTTSGVNVVPVPGAVVLGAIGLSLTGWRLRKRRTS